jgi:hypothetical protein
MRPDKWVNYWTKGIMKYLNRIAAENIYHELEWALTSGHDGNKCLFNFEFTVRVAHRMADHVYLQDGTCFCC